MQHGTSTDITRVVLSVLVIGALLAGSLWTLLPFLGGLIWATTITVATWPALMTLQRLTGGRRAVAAAIMSPSGSPRLHRPDGHCHHDAVRGRTAAAPP